MTYKELNAFIASRPGYFEEVEGLQRIRDQLAEPMETYSRLVDPETFEDIRQRALAAVAEQRSHIERELSNIENCLERTSINLRNAEIQRSTLQRRERARRSAAAAWPTSRQERRHGRLGHGGAIALDALGAAFLYLGILTYQGISPSLVMLGLFLIASGFIWSARIGFSAPKPKYAAAPEAQELHVPKLRERRKLIDTEIKLLVEERTHLETELGRLKSLLATCEQTGPPATERRKPNDQVLFS